MSRDPTLAEVIRRGMDARIADIHVALPGRVESYDVATQKANVQPLLKRVIASEDGEEVLRMPVINDVPVIFPRGGGFFLSFPIQAGDHVLLIMNERSIDKWVVNDGGEVNPDDLRMHDLSDAVAYPGFYPFTKSVDDAHASNLVIGKDGGKQIHVKSAQVALGSENPADFVALANLVSSQLSSIATALTTHVHAGVTPGPSLTGVAAPVYVPGSVASTVVKSD